MMYLYLIPLALVILWAISTYNLFITLGERVDNAVAQIAAQMESRWEAVKSLIDATKKYAEHEAKLLSDITESRARLGQNPSLKEIEQDSQRLDSVIGRLIAVSENYPDLKASQVYQTTMESINQYENHVRQSRMIYNDVVTKFNRHLKVFPSSIIGKAFGFTSKEYFQTTQGKAEMPGWG